MIQFIPVPVRKLLPDFRKSSEMFGKERPLPPHPSVLSWTAAGGDITIDKRVARLVWRCSVCRAQAVARYEHGVDSNVISPQWTQDCVEVSSWNTTTPLKYKRPPMGGGFYICGEKSNPYDNTSNL